jgi:hypothetical protein
MSSVQFAADPWNAPNASEIRGTMPARTGSVCSVSGTASLALTTQLSSARTMKLSMIVTITSCAPKRALSAPGTAPTALPARQAAATHSTTAIATGVPAGSQSPAMAAPNPPAASCPSPPMLNIPARIAIATASPVQVSVVAL